MAKRIVIWGTGFVGKMVIPEVLDHPEFELVGVGVSNPAKVGVDVGEICGLAEPVGIAATDGRLFRPADRGQNQDRRSLALRIYWAELKPASAPGTAASSRTAGSSPAAAPPPAEAPRTESR